MPQVLSLWNPAHANKQISNTLQCVSSRNEKCDQPVCALLESFPLCVYAVNSLSFLRLHYPARSRWHRPLWTHSLAISPESMTSISSSCMTFRRLVLLESTETSYQCPSLTSLHTLFSVIKLLAILQRYWKVYSNGMRTEWPYVILCTVMQFCGPKQR